jgi:alpha-N-arabinofuranosidase
VRIANLAQLVNAIAPIFTRRDGLFLQTIYHPLRLYAEHTREFALDVAVESPTHELAPGHEEGGWGRVHHVADLGPFAMLDASATCDAGGTRLTLAVVNRDCDHAHRAAIALGEAAVTGDVLVSEVNGSDVGAANSFETPRAVDVRETRLTARGHRLEHEFPAHSISILRLPLG